MNENEIKARDERKRIIDTLFFYGVSEKKIELYDVIIENVSWMKVKLDETREAIKQSKVAISYDNGGGQKGIRENPIFKGYESLWKSYMSGMQKILELIPEEKAEEVKDEIEKPKTTLEIIRSRKHA